jgi:Ni,Fe-hydrogenase I large subunit
LGCYTVGAAGTTPNTPTTTTTGQKVNFASPATGTLTSDQAILNKLSSGEVKKNTDNTYSVLKAFAYNGVNYKVGDTIVKILPKGSVVTTTTTIKPK